MVAVGLRYGGAVEVSTAAAAEAGAFTAVAAAAADEVCR